jgi:hypothetical protein
MGAFGSSFTEELFYSFLNMIGGIDGRFDGVICTAHMCSFLFSFLET